MEKDWKEFKHEELEFEGRKAYLVKPDCEPNGRLAIYMEYFWAFPDTAVELLNRGWHIAGLVNKNRWGLEEDQDARHRFFGFLREKYGFEDRFAAIGMSCGGLHAVKHAGMHPEDIAVLYLDAPVINLLSCPMKCGKGTAEPELVRECLDALGMTESEMISYRRHPLDFLPVLAEHRIPVILLYGDRDDGVYYEENGALLEKEYQRAGAPVRVICKPGCGHHPHGLEDPSVIADFMDAHR